MIVHEYPDAAVREKGRKLLELKAKSNKAAYRNTLREYLRTDLWFLIRAGLRWWYFDEKLHGQELMKFIYEPKENRDKAIFLPRGHGKSLFTIARLVQYPLRDVNEKILVASATKELSQKMGGMWSDIMLSNDMLKEAFPEIIPKSKASCEMWGMRGYNLPCSDASIDPTLFCASLRANVTGKHPSIIILDDILVPETDNPAGYNEVKGFLKQCKALAMPHTWIEINGTRYNDKDPYQGIIDGEIKGAKGDFDYIIRSCYKDDDEKKSPIYPLAKKRWNKESNSGFSHELLDLKRAELGSFFNAQYRNNPIPFSDIQMKRTHLNVYKAEELPAYGACRAVGIEIAGSGRIIYQMLAEELEKLLLFMPLTTMKPLDRYGSKVERIMGELEPLVRERRIYCQEWMIGHDTDMETLAYELERLGAAKHDDIVDTLHMIKGNLVKGLTPAKGDLADLYIGVDIAYTQAASSDYTVVMAVVIDDNGNYWVVDYDRFKVKSPSAIVKKIMQFYQRINSAAKEDVSSGGVRSRKKVFSLASSYN